MTNLSMPERVASLETSVDEIKTNHLPHIQAAIDRVDDKVDRTYTLLWGILITILAGLIGLLAYASQLKF